MVTNGRTDNNTSERYEMTSSAAEGEHFDWNILEIPWRRRWTILLTTAVALAAGFLYILQATPLYTSTSRVYVTQAGPVVLERNASGAMARGDAYLHTQVELLQSSGTLATAVQSRNLRQMRAFADVGDPIAALRGGLDVVVGKRDEIINVSFTCADPKEAADIVNAVVNAYISSHNRRRSVLSAEVVKILREERTKREDELNQKHQRLLDFELQNEGLVFGTARESNVILSTLERLRVALTEAELTTIESKSFCETCKAMVENPTAMRQYIEARGGRTNVVSQTNSLQAELQRLERERADCLQRLKPDTPAIAALDAEMARIRQQIIDLDKEFAITQLAVAEKQLMVAQEKEKELRAHFEKRSQEAMLLNSQLAQYALLQGDYEQTKRFCDVLEDRIRVFNVDPQVGALTVEVVEVAAPSASPSKPQKATTMGLALCLGLFTGMGLALHREWKDPRLRSTQEISLLFGLPILGKVPSMTSPKQTAVIRGQKVRISPDSHEAETFRGIRTAILLGTAPGRSRTILVTSPGPGEGKSTVVSNLAISMTRAEQRVVVVDANLRHPNQHILFNMDRTAKGLSSVLTGKMSLEEAVERTRIENLSVLASGPAMPNSAEMIYSERFVGIIKQLAEQYDRVIIDSPPVAPVTDSLILAACCDATVLVLRSHVSIRTVSVQALGSLMGVNARILGIVVNDVPSKEALHGYGQYGGYAYLGSRGNGHQEKQEKAGQEIVRRQGKRMKSESVPA
jgi:polysaccharide biosynthesis transport protein